MDLNAIYTELIMEHSTSKHNKRNLDNQILRKKVIIQAVEMKLR